MLVLLGAVCGIVSAVERPEQEKPGLPWLVRGREQSLGDIFTQVYRCQETVRNSRTIAVGGF